MTLPAAGADDGGMSVHLAEPDRMDGRTVVITGASSGIGRAAAVELAGLGASVVVVGRNEERTRNAAAQVGGTPYLVDYTRLATVRQLAERLLADLPRIHVLANNAGGIGAKETTADGYDATFQQNHLGGFLLTNLLLPRLRETAADAPAGSVRIIQTSSSANLFGRIRLDDLDTRRGPWLRGFRAYGRSKLENIVFTRELARRFTRTGISAYAFHPGIVDTNFGQGGAAQVAINRLTGIPPEKGAEPLVRLASVAQVPAPSGNFFDRLKAPGRTVGQADDPGLAKALWSASEVRVALR